MAIVQGIPVFQAFIFHFKCYSKLHLPYASFYAGLFLLINTLYALQAITLYRYIFMRIIQIAYSEWDLLNHALCQLLVVCNLSWKLTSISGVARGIWGSRPPPAEEKRKREKEKTEKIEKKIKKRKRKILMIFMQQMQDNAPNRTYVFLFFCADDTPGLPFGAVTRNRAPSPPNSWLCAWPVFTGFTLITSTKADTQEGCMRCCSNED